MRRVLQRGKGEECCQKGKGGRGEGGWSASVLLATFQQFFFFYDPRPYFWLLFISVFLWSTFGSFSTVFFLWSASVLLATFQQCFFLWSASVLLATFQQCFFFNKFTSHVRGVFTFHRWHSLLCLWFLWRFYVEKPHWNRQLYASYKSHINFCPLIITSHAYKLATLGE